jgi:hypothetical protein
VACVSVFTHPSKPTAEPLVWINAYLGEESAVSKTEHPRVARRVIREEKSWDKYRVMRLDENTDRKVVLLDLAKCFGQADRSLEGRPPNQRLVDESIQNLLFPKGAGKELERQINTELLISFVAPQHPRSLPAFRKGVARRVLAKEPDLIRGGAGRPQSETIEKWEGKGRRRFPPLGEEGARDDYSVSEAASKIGMPASSLYAVLKGRALTRDGQGSIRLSAKDIDDLQAIAARRKELDNWRILKKLIADKRGADEPGPGRQKTRKGGNPQASEPVAGQG